MKLCVVGTGYVGLVAGTCFAESGNDVICVDIDEAKVETLQKGGVPIYEPGLEELIRRNLAERRLWFTSDLVAAVRASEMCFIAVGTPEASDGSADLRGVLKVAEEIGASMNGYRVIVCKSTVPVGTADKVRAAIRAKTTHEFDVVSNPEFLKEGAAVDDFMKPDRVVIGGASQRAIDLMLTLYKPFVRTENPIIVMDNRSAEMTKYAANAFLATRISFVNEIANLCERVGADVADVRRGMGSDRRIGHHFLFPGVGYGGIVLPEGRAGDHPHGARERSRVPAPQRGRGGEREAEAPARAQGRPPLRGGSRRPAASRSGAWPSSRAPTTCARRRRSSSSRNCCAAVPPSTPTTPRR